MAIAYRSRGSGRLGTIYYPDVGGTPLAGDVVFLAMQGPSGITTISSDTTGGLAEWTLIGVAGNLSLYWRRLTANITGTQSVTLSPAGSMGQMVAYSGIRATSTPYSAFVSDYSATSSTMTTSPPLSGYDFENAFLIGVLGRSGAIATQDSVTFDGLSGGIAVEDSANNTTVPTVFFAHQDGSSGVDGASVTFRQTGNQANRGVFLLDLTDKAAATEVSVTSSTSWNTFSAASTTPSTSWNNLESATKIHGPSTWNVLNTVNATSTSTQWSVFSMAKTTLSSSWSVFSPVFVNKDTQWRVYTGVEASASTSWTVRTATETLLKSTDWTVLTQSGSLYLDTRWITYKATTEGVVSVLVTSPPRVTESSPLTTAQFQAPKNSLLLAFGQSVHVAVNHSIVDSAGLVWTKQREAVAIEPSSGVVSVWTARVPEDSNLTVTLTVPGSAFAVHSLKVYVLANTGESAVGNISTFTSPNEAATFSAVSSVVGSATFFAATTDLNGVSGTNPTSTNPNWSAYNGSSQGGTGYVISQEIGQSLSLSVDASGFSPTHWLGVAVEIVPPPLYIPVEISLSTGWSTSAIAQLRASASWHTYLSVTETYLEQWNVLLSAASVTENSWAVYGAVKTSRLTAWNVAKVAQRTTATRWNLYIPVDKTTHSTQWNVLQGVSTIINATNWNIYAIARMNTQTRWRTYGIASSLKFTGWDLYTPIQLETHTTEWSVYSATMAHITTEWAIYALATLIRSTRWKIFPVINPDQPVQIDLMLGSTDIDLGWYDIIYRAVVGSTSTTTHITQVKE